ncbi:MAG: TRAP transporter small permease [Rhodospirillaceae bacterium]|nr:TRAP transporter small permease [Rhodospirillaceae bacterium]MDD9926327.1 TRAP transporter small permease [Rhodospirillaceae bacterium]
MLDRLLEQAEKVSQIIVWIGGGLLIFAAIMTTLEVLLRKFANFSFGGADEIAGYIFAISTSFAFAFATLHRAHVRIDALYMRLPQPVRLFLDVVGFLLLGGFLLLMAERAYNVWWNSFENSSVSITPLVTPLALPQGFWFAGMVFFFIVFALMLLRIITAAFSRDWNRIAALVGPRGIEEEVEEEREHAMAELKREQSLMKDKEGD